MTRAYTEALETMRARAIGPRVLVAVARKPTAREPAELSLTDAGAPPVSVHFQQGTLRLKGPGIDYSFTDVVTFSITQTEA